MSSRDSGDPPDPAAELLGRWQAHHDTAPSENSDAGHTEPTPPHRPKHAARPAGRRSRSDAVGRAFDQTAAGREVVEALAAPSGMALGAGPADEPAVPDPPGRRPRTEAAPRPSRAPVVTGTSTNITFAPRRFARRLMAVLLLLLLVASGLAGYAAYTDPRTLTLGLAGTLVVTTLAVYAIRAGTVPTVVSIRSGQLEVVRGRDRQIWDLTSRYTRIEEVGTPGRRGWKVLLGRFGRDPFVIDSSAVDPRTFSAELGRLRPPSA